MQTAPTTTRLSQLAFKLQRVIDWAKEHRSPHVKVEGIKTVGVHIPVIMRQRIKGVRDRYNLKSYRDALYLCILAGLDALDAHHTQ